MLFHVIEGAAVVLRSKGVFRQAPVFRRNNQLYARWGGGFIGLRAAYGTTLPHVSWDHIEGVEYIEPRLGCLQLKLDEPAKVRAIR